MKKEERQTRTVRKRRKDEYRGVGQEYTTFLIARICALKNIAHSLKRSLMFRARADIASWTTPLEKAWLDAIFDPRDEIHCSWCTHTHPPSPLVSYLFLLESRISYPRLGRREKPAFLRTEIVNPRSSDSPRLHRDCSVTQETRNVETEVAERNPIELFVFDDSGFYSFSPVRVLNC